MDFPPDFSVFPAEEFATAAPRNPGELGVELLAQARPNGRVVDHYRVTLGGSKIIDVSTKMAKLFQKSPPSWTLNYQVWARDIELRRNMTSSAWASVNTLISSRDAWVEQEDGVQVPVETVLAEIGDKKAAWRFAVIIADNQALELMLQALPTSAEALMGKPAFRG
jgi:hypothetical protein